jgi:hypothetical protein
MDGILDVIALRNVANNILLIAPSRYHNAHTSQDEDVLTWFKRNVRFSTRSRELSSCRSSSRSVIDRFGGDMVGIPSGCFGDTAVDGLRR